MQASDAAWVLLALLHLIAIFGFVLVQRREPSATLSWLLLLMFLPGLGVLLFVALGRQRALRRSVHARAVSRRVKQALSGHELAFEAQLREAIDDPRTKTLMALAERTTGNRLSACNSCRTLVNGAETYAAMLEAIEAATHHVHLLFYIVRPDATGRALRDQLAQRARAGVQVRFIYDAIGSLGLPDDFWTPLRDAGGEVAVFNPVGRFSRLRQRDRVDFRNHRKIVVTDGRVGFTGGINIGREYLGLDPAIGHWRDTHVRIEGPAVLTLARVFAEDWLEATDELLSAKALYPEAETPPGDTSVLIVHSGPDQQWQPLHRLYATAIALARERVWITSPYFVPDAVIEHALTSAALSGVDVRLLLPARSDQLLVSLASRGYYRDLLAAGVAIHEYARGFVHAKTLVVDDWMGAVGSANMDIRSFQLNYELNAFMLGAQFTAELASEFDRDLKHAHRVTLEQYEGIPYPRRLLLSAARLLSPLL